jgi:hypothetical protein
MVVGEIFDGQRFRNELPPLFLGDYFLAFLQKLSHVYAFEIKRKKERRRRRRRSKES